MSPPTAPECKHLTLTRKGNIFIITLNKAPENRLTTSFCQEIIRTFHYIQSTLGANSSGAVITTSFSSKFWCTGLDLDEGERDPFANTNGFFPMLHTIMDFPFPTVALLTGHTFGGACPFALAHDYRVMNGERGFISMPPVNLGLHFEGIGTLPRLKLHPQIARKMLLEAHRWTGKEALKDGIVDFVAPPDKMMDVALQVAETWAPKAKMGVYGLLRSELWGGATEAFQKISYVHSRPTSKPALAKI